MAKGSFTWLFFWFLLAPSISTSGPERKILANLNLETKLDEQIDPPPSLSSSSTPITNPANFPPYTPTPTPTPTIITVPSTYPAPITPVLPVSNPTTSFPPPTIPTPTTNAPMMPGQTWCVARTGVPEAMLQQALDYACGIGGADCSVLQQGGSCSNPNTLENHASYAFNSYFQKNPVATSCDFGGAAVLVSSDPSSGSCVYPVSAKATTPSITPPATISSIPGSTPPPTITSSTPGSTPPPATITSTSGSTGSPLAAGVSGSITPPSVLNTSSNPAASGSPAIYDSSPNSDSMPAGAISGSSDLRPFVGFIIFTAMFFTGKLILGV